MTPRLERLIVDGTDVAPVELAFSARARRRGLLGRDGIDGALWLKPCRHVHGLRMRFDLDIAHVDSNGVVLAVDVLRRNRFGRFHRGTRSILEAQVGAFERIGLVAGSRVDHLPAG